MRKINKNASEVVTESTELISGEEQKRFAADICQTMGALSCLLAGQIYQRLFPGQDLVLGLLYMIGVLIIGIPIAITAAKGFLRKDFSSAMEILVTIAILISVLSNEYVVAILTPLLLTLVHFFEEKSIMGGRDTIEGLKKMQSSTAIRLNEREETEVDARELRPGDLILVKPGMSFPIDGAVIKGNSSVDQQSLTGEAIPAYVRPGDAVYAGTLNLDGTLTVKVEKSYTDTSFQKIVKLLEEMEHSSVPAGRIIDKFLQYYIPVAIIAATLCWLFTQEISRAVAILVVSCPCGHMLVSSAPMIASLSMATKRGVLIKSTGFIEILTSVDKVFFDKTGTLTDGNLSIKECIPADGISEKAIFETALCVAIHSLHPLSRAVALHKDEYTYSENFETIEHGGLGVEGIYDGCSILFGNERFMLDAGINMENAPIVEETSTYVARDGVLLGLLVYQDSMREGVPEMVGALKSKGIAETSLLTGDKWEIARRLKERGRLDNVYAQLLPEQKQEIIRNAREGHFIAFIGDGINDSLALSSADVGIAMGAMGVDTAIQSADIALMNTNLSNIPFLFDLAQKTKKIIHQNIAIAFATSIIMAALAALGFVTALPGALLHNSGAFLVLLNSGRILKEARRPYA